MSIPHDRLAESLSAADHDALFAHEDAVDTPWAVVESVLVDHCERSEAQLQEGDRLWEGSVERNREQMDKNRIEGSAEQGERARFRKDFVLKAQAA